MTCTEEEFYQLVGEKIRIARQAAGKNQAELANDVGLKRTSITNIEAGQQKVPLYTLFQIADILHISIVTLLPQSELNEVETDKEELVQKQEVLVNNGSKSNLSETNIKNILNVIK